MKALIVEDDRVSACFLRRMLEQEGHEAVLAENGREAWQRMRTETFSLVISDWLMPVMDGLELFRKIRSRQDAHYTYLILLTSRDQREDRMVGMQAGADDFLTKPLDTDELGARMKVAERLLSMEAELKRKNLELLEASEEKENYLQQIHEQYRQLEKRNAQLNALAITDGLTGLKNHRELQERLDDEIGRAVRYELPLSLIMLDVDHFKAFNDTFGHPTGDCVLKQAADILQSHARDNDIPARYGGEEFAIVLPNTDRERAMAAAERFRNAIMQAPWDRRPITVSVGVATLDRPVQTRTQLTSEADQALYLSKSRGRNCSSHFMDIPSEPVHADHEAGRRVA